MRYGRVKGTRRSDARGRSVRSLRHQRVVQLFDLLPRCDEVLFFSRWSNDPSGDFRELGRQFAERGFAPVFVAKKLSPRSVFSYAAFAVREIRHPA